MSDTTNDSKMSEVPIEQELPIRVTCHPSIAAQFKGGDNVEPWVEQLRRKYPQHSTAKILRSYLHIEEES